MPSPSSLVPELGSTLGVFLLATVISAALYGITVLQTLHYFDKFSKDPWHLRFLVLLLWVLDTVTVVLESHAVYYYLIAHYGDLTVLLDITWSMQLESIFAYVLVFFAQIFYVARIWHLGNRRWLVPLLMGLFTLGAVGTGLTATIKDFGPRTWTSTGFQLFNILATTSAALQIVVDILITVSLCWILSRSKSRLRSTNSSVNHLIIFLVNRGVISLAVQVFSTLTFFVWRNTLIWTAFHMAASKVYCNSVLATLNSRFAIRGEATDSELLATTGKLGVDEIYAGTVDDADEERPESPESPPMIPSIGHGITESENDSWFGTAKFEEENLSRLSFKRANPHDSRSGIAL